MGNCEEYLMLISRSLDGDLDQQEETALQEHLRACPDCQSRYESFLALDLGLRRSDEEIPDTLHAAVMRGIRTENETRSPKSWFRRSKFTMIAAAAAILLIVVSRTGFRFPAAQDFQTPAAAQTEAAIPEVSAELRAGSGLSADPRAEDTDAGAVGARVVADDESADPVLEMLEAAGCSGEVYYIYDLTEEDLEDLLGTLSVVELNPRYTAYGADAETVRACVEAGTLPVIDSDRIGENGSIAWLILE